MSLKNNLKFIFIIFIGLFMFLSLPSPSFAVDIKDLNIEFFNRFNDEYLYSYILEALENNHSAKQATSRVEQYRQQAKISLAAEFPTLSVSADYSGFKAPEIGNMQLSTNAFVLPFIASYEADFFLKNRDKTRSANKMVEISKLDEKTVYLALLSDVATVYTNILEYDALIIEQRKLLEEYEKILVDNNKKFKRGIVDTNVINDSKKIIEIAKKTLEDYEKQRDILLFNLAVLTGKSPTEIDKIKRGTLDNFEYQKTIPQEISSDVIFSRPDVMASEANLEKAKIDIRVARKEFLPKFNITGLWMFNNLVSGTFFSWENSVAMLLAGATQDIFAGGRKIANLKLQKAKYEELFENYKQTDLNAVKEVNTALCIIKQDTKIDEQTNNAFNLQLKNYNNATAKFNRGIISNNDYRIEGIKVLTDKPIQSKAQRLIDYYTLYKVTGGQI